MRRQRGRAASHTRAAGHPVSPPSSAAAQRRRAPTHRLEVLVAVALLRPDGIDVLAQLVELDAHVVAPEERVLLRCQHAVLKLARLLHGADGGLARALQLGPAGEHEALQLLQRAVLPPQLLRKALALAALVGQLGLVAPRSRVELAWLRGGVSARVRGRLVGVGWSWLGGVDWGRLG